MKKFVLLTLAFISLAFASSQAQMSILLVNDNGYAPDRVEVIKDAITNAGYNYAFYDAAAEMAGPTFDFMQSFSLVVWYTGNDGSSLYLWNGDDTANEDIMNYIDDGGMFWLQGLDFLYDKYPETPGTFLPGEFAYDYLGIYYYAGQSHNDDGVWSDGVPQLDIVEGNGIFTIPQILWAYETMWYVDALDKTDDAQYVYRMGPAGYDLSDYYSAIYLERGDGKVLSFAFETARLDTQENTDALFGEGLAYFEQFATAGILVEEITVSSEGGLATIEENGGTLQFSAEVLPLEASIPFVSWSVNSDGVLASINQDGLLQASGTDNGNGMVWVKAEAMDGSGIADSMQVTISGQGTEFTVLLVNDNANGSDRYLVIDTSLTNLDYIYNVYNTVVTGDFPDYNTLDAYDAVIWYTGNDGLNLKLWDVSDTTGAVDTKLKFNAPLMQYINNGGIVWLQGLDFIFDIYGGAFDIFEAGDFMYDFMGISAYVAQSYADGDPLMQMDAVSENPITSFGPVTWTYAEGMHFADALDKTDEAEGIYTMGPSNYIYSEYFTGIYTNPGEGRLFTLTVETARINNRENTDAFFGEVLEYFESLVPNSIGKMNVMADFSLQNSPNPAKDQTTFSYKLTDNADVTFTIFDLSGRKVFFENFGKQTAGQQSFEFYPAQAGLTTGFYTCTLTVNNSFATRKIIIG